MSWLLDVNALLALGFEAHVVHNRVEAWVRELEFEGAPVFVTCPITELGFVRILPQLTRFKVDVTSAKTCSAS